MRSKPDHCPHNRIMGDNYGKTCMDCGKVLAGYGCWCEGIKDSDGCIHEWVFDPEVKTEYCIYCEEVRN